MSIDNRPTLAARLREVSDGCHPTVRSLLAEAADEIDFLDARCDEYSDHIATTGVLIDELRLRVTDL